MLDPSAESCRMIVNVSRVVNAEMERWTLNCCNVPFVRWEYVLHVDEGQMMNIKERETRNGRLSSLGRDSIPRTTKSK